MFFSWYSFLNQGLNIFFEMSYGIGDGGMKTWKHDFIISLMHPTNKNQIVHSLPAGPIDCCEKTDIPVLLGTKDFLCHFNLHVNYSSKSLQIHL